VSELRAALCSSWKRDARKTYAWETAFEPQFSDVLQLVYCLVVFGKPFHLRVLSDVGLDALEPFQGLHDEAVSA
jgi:hypothetical protein